MENKELNSRILKNVRSKIVVSALEREESMKIEKRKQVISLCVAIMIIFSGGLLTVNAATNGKVMEEIKNFIQIDYDQSKYKITSEQEKIDNLGDEHVTYTLESNDGQQEYMIDINKSELENQNFVMNQKITETTVEGETQAGLDVTISNKN